jgi:hypothetical protein
VLANTEVLHDKILQLSNRVRNLEDALAETYALLSTGHHPLLSEDLLAIKRPLEHEQQHDLTQISEDNPPSDSNDQLDTLGSLWVRSCHISLDDFSCLAGQFHRMVDLVFSVQLQIHG